MNYQEYLGLFPKILSGEMQAPPYDNPAYLNYAKLNYARMNRWDGVLELSEPLAAAVEAIAAPQSWIVIAEPWCGDAAPALPFLARLADLNPLIAFEIQLRDQEPFLIDAYLTKGGKSIPKLIVRNAAGEDLFTWGPRPRPAQELVDELKAADMAYEQRSLQLQKWYNNDKGVTFQEELLACFQNVPKAIN